MKIAIVGAGAMGGLFGARLALAGQDVSFVEASDHAIEIISRQGLRLETPDVQASVQVPIGRATQFSGHVDLLVIFTKGFHTAAAIDSVRHLVGPDSWALSVQNGLGNAELIAEVVPAERVIVGMTNFPADLVAPGVVHSHGEGYVNLWSYSGEDSPVVREVAAVFSQAGLACEGKGCLQRSTQLSVCRYSADGRCGWQLRAGAPGIGQHPCGNSGRC